MYEMMKFIEVVTATEKEARYTPVSTEAGKNSKSFPGLTTLLSALLACSVALHFFSLSPWSLTSASALLSNNGRSSQYTQPAGERIPETVYHSLHLSMAWRNPDGGHWRPIFVGNGKSPIATFDAHEGDIVKINIQNDLGVPTTVHWVGMHHGNSATWNDGTSGLTQYPILPRANWTSTLNTTNQWGLKWFLEHVSTPSVDGMYGLLWIAPSSARARPYHLISDDPTDLQDMRDAEQKPRHVTVYNYQHKPMDWLLGQLQSEGYDPYCFNSILINGKGRVHCKPESLEDIDGKVVDANGCVKQPTGAVAYPDCTPSDGDYEIIESNNQKWMFINFVNPGLEHPYRISIDEHEMWVVANDGGFITPQKVDAITLTNAERVTVMVKLDKVPKDYAIRFYALSRLQFIQGYAILRYPHRPVGRLLGQPEPRPREELSVLELDGTPKRGVRLDHKATQHPFPPSAPPAASDVTLHFRATGAPDPYNPYITNCSLNGVSWQIFRGLREPLIMNPKRKFKEPNPIVTKLPLGSVVDIIVQNDLPVAIPMYKHNDPTYLLGSAANEKFPWANIAEAQKEQPELLNLENPPLGYLHELPAGGWLAVRWKITQPAMTMFHAFRVRYFVLGMQVPMFEGDDHWPEVPREVLDQPHVEFDLPEHMGIFD